MAMGRFRSRDREKFYTSPPLNADGKPGDLLRFEQTTTRVMPGIASTARAWRVLYRSTNATGDAVIVSGTILVPTGQTPAAGSRPLLGFAPGTQGHANYACTSRQMRWGVEYETGFILTALRRGWVVAVTDYPGLGTPGVHPYIVGRALGPTVLDIMRAARALPEAELDDDGPAGVYGYSEGGHAAGWAAQLQPSYAPDMPIDAIVVGAAPVDLPDLIDTLDGGLFAFLLLYVAIGYNSAYPELQLSRYLNRFGRVAMKLLGATHIAVAIMLGLLLPKRRRRYVSVDPLREANWQSRIVENSLGFIAPAAPVMVGGGQRDQVIPYRQMSQLAEHWRSLGVDVREYPIARGEHITAAPRFAKAGFAFLDDHFRQHPTPTVEPIAS